MQTPHRKARPVRSQTRDLLAVRSSTSWCFWSRRTCLCRVLHVQLRVQSAGPGSGPGPDQRPGQRLDKRPGARDLQDQDWTKDLDLDQRGDLQDQDWTKDLELDHFQNLDWFSELELDWFEDVTLEAEVTPTGPANTEGVPAKLRAAEEVPLPVSSDPSWSDSED
ncbi:hypothetical protein WMY93_033383 [Mugilogobius chulae]|uniref:Uncharacterized protein n=1 Tax=Mugilogobius chulae TaxID=88201 RepID=A0AAW0MLD3_9GOBI